MLFLGEQKGSATLKSFPTHKIGTTCFLHSFTNFIYFAVDTTPQFETREFNATENKNASFELPFSALDKERMAAIVSLVIVKGW